MTKRIYQSYNPKIKAYVKYKVQDGKSKIFNVKQKKPSMPFKGVKIK